MPTVPGVVQRADPRRAIQRKLEFLAWLDKRIAEARAPTVFEARLHQQTHGQNGDDVR